MTDTSQKRGHKIYYDGNNWMYSDNDNIAEHERTCKHCGRLPTEKGYDACLGELPKVKHACCGHGKEAPIIIWEG